QPSVAARCYFTLWPRLTRRDGSKSYGKNGLRESILHVLRGVCRGAETQMMEFHISRKARERYRFAESLFSYNGNVVFASLAACRTFAHQMNQVRQADKYPDLAVHAGALFAMGLIDEASHVLMARYREQF